jgi:cytochrome c
MKMILALTAACGLMTASVANAAVDAAAAQALLKKSACTTCHAVDKTKAATSFKDVAKKYKGKADAQDKLVKHITTKPIVEKDGEKMPHAVIKTTDAAEIKNVVDWILAQ